jgi:hypothetical protein
MFPRPPDISKAYGGGRTLKPGQELESEDDRAARARRVTKVPPPHALSVHVAAGTADLLITGVPAASEWQCVADVAAIHVCALDSTVTPCHPKPPGPCRSSWGAVMWSPTVSSLVRRL